jgi:hypothetical protein
VRQVTLFASVIIIVVTLLVGQAAVCIGEDLPYFLRDRGQGVPLSMFGTYVEKGGVILYLYYEYYYDQDAEYSPDELCDEGVCDESALDFKDDFEGRYRAHEGLIFLGYGLTDDLALELEAAVITAKQYKADDDTSRVEDVVEESGLGDVESQLRWRWARETAGRPELFSYFETVFPFQKDRKLIGTPDWEFKLGTGLTKGFRWGTMTFRLAGEYSAEESKFEFGEYAAEYLRRVSRFFRFYVGVEGSQDEIELITDLQLHLFRRGFIRINNAFGVTPKATDYAPEVGILFYF